MKAITIICIVILTYSQAVSILCEEGQIYVNGERITANQLDALKVVNEKDKIFKSGDWIQAETVNNHCKEIVR